MGDLRHPIGIHALQDVNTNPLNALIPIFLVIFITIYGLFSTGSGGSIQAIIGSADSYAALTWASLIGVVSAIILSIIQKIQILC